MSQIDSAQSNGWDDFEDDLKKHFLNNALETLQKFITEEKDSASLVDLKEFLIPHLQEWSQDAEANKLAYLHRFIKSYENVLKSAASSQQSIEVYLEELHRYIKSLIDGEEDNEVKLKKALKAGKGKQLFLHCYAGANEFVVPIQNVIEVVTSREVYPLPDRRDGISGMLSFRGESVPLVNLAYFGFSSARKDDHRFFVICDFMNIRFALEVTQTADVLDLTDHDMQETVDPRAMTAASFVSQFINRDSKTILVFDLEKLVAA